MLGLIFLGYAEHRFEQVRPELEAKATARRPVTPDDYRARSVLFISEEARVSYLVNLPEKEDLGAAVDTAMRLVETHSAELVERHQGSATEDLSVYGQEQKEVTVPLAQMASAPARNARRMISRRSAPVVPAVEISHWPTWALRERSSRCGGASTRRCDRGLSLHEIGPSVLDRRFGPPLVGHDRGVTKTVAGQLKSRRSRSSAPSGMRIGLSERRAGQCSTLVLSTLKV